VELDEEKKSGYMRRIAARILDAAARIKKNVTINSKLNHAIFAHELQIVFRLTAGFSNIYCKL
jgi:hypothetical protein